MEHGVRIMRVAFGARRDWPREIMTIARPFSSLLTARDVPASSHDETGSGAERPSRKRRLF